MVNETVTRVLVLDDDASIRDLYVESLEPEGFSVQTAPDGQAGLEALKKEKFPVVLADIQMPRMDGLQFLKKAKTDFPESDVILMTAYGNLASAVEALRWGAYDYIIKPFSKDALLAALRRCVERRNLSRDLRVAQEELLKKEKLVTLGSMAAWLAHRMRNPLNVIMMCSQYLKTKFPDKDEKREVVSAIEEKVKTLEIMTRDFIQFSRTYQPKLRLDDVHKILEHVLGTMSSRFQIQKVTVEKKLEAPSPFLPLDRDLMEEVFGYLFDNALEAMDGPGALSVSTRQTAERVVLEVSNTGQPIPADVRERIFEPFFTTKERGTGLGLAITRRVVESHGGKIFLLPQEITTFRIELPILIL